MTSLTPSMRRILEIAGTLEHHEKEEHRLFHHVRQALGELESFCGRQHESDVYGPISHQAKSLATKLEHHFDRYKNMSAEKKKEIQHPETKEDKKEDKEMTEKWEHEAHINPAEKGKHSHKSLEELHSQLAAAKKAGNTSLERELNFAIRAKTGWGKV